MRTLGPLKASGFRSTFRCNGPTPFPTFSTQAETQLVSGELHRPHEYPKYESIPAVVLLSYHSTVQSFLLSFLASHGLSCQPVDPRSTSPNPFNPRAIRPHSNPSSKETHPVSLAKVSETDPKFPTLYPPFWIRERDRSHSWFHQPVN